MHSRPITRCDRPDGGPLRYRVVHTASLWKPGERRCCASPGEPQRYRARPIYDTLGVDSRHQDSRVSTVYTMARTSDLLPGTLNLLILRTLQKEVLHGWAVSERVKQISR